MASPFNYMVVLLSKRNLLVERKLGSRKFANAVIPVEPRERVEERIRSAASALFNGYGIYFPTIWMIARLAETNSETVLRRFGSKERLMVDFLEEVGKSTQSDWNEVSSRHPGDPDGHLREWLEDSQDIASDPYFGRHFGRDSLSRAAAGPEQVYPKLWAVIKKHKAAERARLAELCQKAGYRAPNELADKLFMLVEGAHAAAECVGRAGPALHLIAAGEALMASHAALKPLAG